MKKLLINLEFWFEYYIGYHLTNANKIHRWEKNLRNKFPEKFNNKK